MSRRLFLLLLSAALTLPAFAKGKKATAPTEPGSYQKWGPDIDSIEIVKSFDPAGYKSVVVLPFDSSETELPKKDDNTWEPVQKVLATAAEPFAAALKEHSRKEVSVEEKVGKTAGTLVVRGKIVTMDPGSKAKRYFAGFGAGAARTKIEGELVDARSGEVLLRFTQERRSGVGMMGGDYVGLMNRNLRAIGEDVANLLAVFSGER